MGIKEDAGELLILSYNRYTKGKTVESVELPKLTKWDSERINTAFNYLKDAKLIKVWEGIGSTNGLWNFSILGLRPLGINQIEDKKGFKKHFGFEIGIPLVFKFSWGASEK